MRLLPLFLLLCVLAGGCSPREVGTADAATLDAPPDVAELPPCSEAAVLYTRNEDDDDVVLEEGSELGVVRGFQGFVFSRVGIRSPHPLPVRSVVRSRAVVHGTDQDVVSQHGNVFSTADATAGGWRTDPVWLFYNDATITDLIGHEATLSLRVYTTECTLTGSVDVQLVPGGFMGREGFEEHERDRDPRRGEPWR